MELRGLEPLTSSLQMRRSSQLNYSPNMLTTHSNQASVFKGPHLGSNIPLLLVQRLLGIHQTVFQYLKKEAVYTAVLYYSILAAVSQ